MPNIILPSNPQIRKSLIQKRHEYFQRTKRLNNRLREEEIFMHPEKRVHHIMNSDGVYKIRIINRLLRKGVVNSEELSLEIAEKYGIDFFDEHAFDNACGIIKVYCQQGTTNIAKLVSMGVPIKKN